jgi:imidazole glycerol-phosphate synthase subunit HisH
MQRVIIIDYGSGNLHSAAKALERAARENAINAQIEISADPRKVITADRIVLPGVGAFADCKRGLEKIFGMRAALEDTVHRKNRPFLGICVGMQLMATRGLEFEVTPGLGWVDGDVKPVTPRDPHLKIPHMGWNTLAVECEHALLKGIPVGPAGMHAYFVHSFHLEPRKRSVIVAQTDYGGPVTAMVADRNLAGTQFHPEKSQALGLKLLANFLTWHPSS